MPVAVTVLPSTKALPLPKIALTAVAPPLRALLPLADRATVIAEALEVAAMAALWSAPTVTLPLVAVRASTSRTEACMSVRISLRATLSPTDTDSAEEAEAETDSAAASTSESMREASLCFRSALAVTWASPALEPRHGSPPVLLFHRIDG